MNGGIDKCMEKLEEAIEEVRALTTCIVEGTPSAQVTTRLRSFLMSLKSHATPAVMVGITASIDVTSEVYGSSGDLSLVFDELFRNSFKAHANRVFVSVADRGGHTYKVLFSDNGDGMTKYQVDNLGCGPTNTDRGGHGVMLLRGLMHNMGGHMCKCKKKTTLKSIPVSFFTNVR